VGIFGRKKSDKDNPEQEHKYLDLDMTQESLGFLALGMKSAQIKEKLGAPASNWTVIKDRLWIYPALGLTVATDRYKIRGFIVAACDPQFRDFRRCTRKFMGFRGNIIFQPGTSLSLKEISASAVQDQFGSMDKLDVEGERIKHMFIRNDQRIEFEFAAQGMLTTLRFMRADPDFEPL